MTYPLSRSVGAGRIALELLSTTGGVPCRADLVVENLCAITEVGVSLGDVQGTPSTRLVGVDVLDRLAGLQKQRRVSRNLGAGASSRGDALCSLQSQ